MSVTSHEPARVNPLAPRQRAPVPGTPGRWLSRLLIALLALSGLLAFGYVGVSTYIATKLVYQAPTPVIGTPAQYGLKYAYVTFPARDDGL